MKLIHLSDLHLGKRVNEFSMLNDQQYILEQILHIIRSENPDAVLIAGDVYDKSVPTVEAVQLFDEFLTRLAGLGIRVLIISGNHDSAERTAFGGRLMSASGVYIAPVYDGTVRPVTLQDEFGPVNIFMLPFVKPAHVRRYYEDEEIASYSDAIRVAVAHMEVNPAQRNLLMTHQFVTGAQRSESEDISVGGTDNVSAEIFDCFDYVALGHLHAPQSVQRPTLRYCGSPLKYSFSEAKNVKSVTVVELGEKGSVRVDTRPLTPLHDLREIRGEYEALVTKANYEGTDTQDYMHITLTDEEDVPDAVNKLRTVYPNIMKLDYDNTRTRTSREISSPVQVEEKSPLELFAEFYEKQNNQPMTDQQTALSKKLMEHIWEDML